MIFDGIENLSDYGKISEKIGRLCSYLQNHNLAEYAAGHYVVDQDIYFDIKEYEPRRPEEANWETHKEYMDIQYLINGRERMGVMRADHMKVRVPYDADHDKVLYEDSEEASYLKIKEGSFVLLLPQDAHLPSLADGKPERNKKAVIKLRV